MGLDFRIQDFAYPLAIMKQKSFFDKTQWWGLRELESYQLGRLKTVLVQASEHVPYYRDLFRHYGLKPSDICSFADFKKVPFLTKNIIQHDGDLLVADNADQFKPRWVSTSGTTGGRIKLCMDKSSNILEFVYYWRFWGWAGYRLGDTFAEISAERFLPFEKNKGRFFEYQPLGRRLLLNSLLLSKANAARYVKILNKFKPKFLKGLASNLYALALMVGEQCGDGIYFEAVFSQGENLLKYQREKIEKTFSCKIHDSYGHMERTVTISECPKGNYHVNMDYGLLEIEPVNDIDVAGGLNGDEYVGEIVGTGLHNYAMPLIRYRTGDWVKVRRNPEECPCGRKFPTVLSVLGRDTDIIVTPDGRMITALYVAFDRTPGILKGQIIQEARDALLVRVAVSHVDEKKLVCDLEKNIRYFTGEAVRIRIELWDLAQFPSAGKFKNVISEIKSENCDAK